MTPLSSPKRRHFASLLQSPWLRWAASRPYPLIAVAIFAGMAFSFLLRTDSEWDDVYVKAANRLAAGEAIYVPGGSYVYPPVMAFLAIPFTFLPQILERLAWFGISVGCMSLMIVWAWRLSGGGPVPTLRPADWREHLIWLLGLGCAFRYMLDCIAHQQTDLLTGALVLGGCMALARARPFWAASGFGLAAGIKCTPLLWVAYLVWRRRWLAAGWMILAAASVNLLPDLVHSAPDGRWWLTVWGARYLVPLTNSAYYPGQWYSEIVYNQSLSGTLHRWLLTTWSWEPGSLVVADQASRLRPLEFKALLSVVVGAFLVGAMLTLRKSGKLAGDENADRGTNREALEYSLFLLLMVFLSPMSSKPHFCILLRPALCLARRAIQSKSRLQLAFVAAAALAGLLGMKGLWGGEVAALALWYANVTVSALCLFAGCLVALRNRSSSAGSGLIVALDKQLPARRAA
jgi:hypothetical protein